MLTLQYVRETPADEAFPSMSGGMCYSVAGFKEAWCAIQDEHVEGGNYYRRVHFPAYLPYLFRRTDGEWVNPLEQQHIRVQVLRVLAQGHRITPARLAAALVQVTGILAPEYAPGWCDECWRTIHRIAQREAHNA